MLSIKNRIIYLLIIIFSLFLIYIMPTCFVNVFSLMGFSHISHHVMQQNSSAKVFEFSPEKKLELDMRVPLQSLLPEKNTIFVRFNHSFRGIYVIQNNVLFEVSFDRWLRIVDIYTKDKIFINYVIQNCSAKGEWTIKNYDSNNIACYKTKVDTITIKNWKISDSIFLVVIWGVYFLIWPYLLSCFFLAIRLFYFGKMYQILKWIQRFLIVVFSFYTFNVIAYSFICFFSCIS